MSVLPAPRRVKVGFIRELALASLARRGADMTGQTPTLVPA